MVYVKPSRDVLQPKRNSTLHFKPNGTTRIYDMMGMVLSAAGQVVLDSKTVVLGRFRTAQARSK